MIASCGVVDWDSLSLFVNRMTIIAVCLGGTVFCGRRTLRRDRVSMVPRWMWAIPMVTMSALVVMVTGFVATCTVVLSLWERTVYGALLIWTVLALLAIIIVGHRRVEHAVKLSRTYQEQVISAVTELGINEVLDNDIGSGGGDG